MIVASPSPQAVAAAAPLSDTAKADLDYNSFLKLLIATMQNQDPTKPNDPAETLSQLASFSAVEQNIKLNSKLDSLLALSGVGQAASMIGKTVESLDEAVTGIARAVETGASGVVVILDTGARLPLTGGVRIS